MYLDYGSYAQMGGELDPDVYERLAAKAELCEPRVERKCCAVAEAYGILMYCHTFSPKLIRIITASDELAQRLPHLFKKAFSVSFDELPGGSGKRSFKITDEKKIQTIYDTFGNDLNTPSLHINFGVLEETCCKASFIRGAFLAGGSVTDPSKRYHLELATSHYSVSREAYSILLDMGFSPKEAERKRDDRADRQGRQGILLPAQHRLSRTGISERDSESSEYLSQIRQMGHRGL